MLRLRAIGLGQLERLQELGDLAVHVQAGLGDDVAEAPAFDQSAPQAPHQAEAQGDGQGREGGRYRDGDGDVRQEDDEAGRNVQQQLHAMLDAVDLGGEERVEVRRPLAPQVRP